MEAAEGHRFTRICRELDEALELADPAEKLLSEWLDKPGAGRKIAETASKTQFDAMNNRSNGEPRLNS